MSTLNELQSRLAVATERNRQNTETRNALLKEAKDKYGCESVEELRAKTEQKGEEVTVLSQQAADAKDKAEAAVEAVEVAVGVRI